MCVYKPMKDGNCLWSICQSIQWKHNHFLLTLQIRDQLPKLKAIVQYTKELVEKEESVMDVS